MSQDKKRVFILGATGSIGQSTLSIIRQHPDKYEVYGVTGHSNIDLLAQIILELNPKFAVLTSPVHYVDLQKQLLGKKTTTEIITSEDELQQLVAQPEIDIVVAGIVGKSGLVPTLAAAQAGRSILLANKESMVMAGRLFRQAILEHGANIFPIDSEHNAIFQTLPASIQSTALVTQQLCESRGIDSLVLTASGGPFLKMSTHELEHVTPEQACKHPNWSMGAKVSVDSASLMNKGLELIEACYLFGVKESFVDVVIHPQSIVHSMVTYIDGSTLAHLSNPNMEIPIASGLAWPDRHTTQVKPMRWHEARELQFLPLPDQKFPCFALARQAMLMVEQQESSGATIVLNAANEIAVDAFLQKQIGFTFIPKIVENCLDTFAESKATTLNEILALDQEVRHAARDFIS